jgi:crossover junction endodeoxyribonuclease RuvC
VVRILACDPATHFGWAHNDGASGTWDLSIRRDESGGMRLIRLRAKLDEVKAAVGVDLLVFEAARNAGPKMQGALVVQAELQGVLKLWCEENGVEYRGYSPSEIKRHATTKGNASKADVFTAARRRWSHVKSDDEADAMWLLDLAMQELGVAPCIFYEGKTSLRG